VGLHDDSSCPAHGCQACAGRLHRSLSVQCWADSPVSCNSVLATSRLGELGQYRPVLTVASPYVITVIRACFPLAWLSVTLPIRARISLPSGQVGRRCLMRGTEPRGPLIAWPRPNVGTWLGLWLPLTYTPASVGTLARRLKRDCRESLCRCAAGRWPYAARPPTDTCSASTVPARSGIVVLSRLRAKPTLISDYSEKQARHPSFRLNRNIACALTCGNRKIKKFCGHRYYVRTKWSSRTFSQLRAYA
jgi:hypothetical protein